MWYHSSAMPPPLTPEQISTEEVRHRLFNVAVQQALSAAPAVPAVAANNPGNAPALIALQNNNHNIPNHRINFHIIHPTLFPPPTSPHPFAGLTYAQIFVAGSVNGQIIPHYTVPGTGQVLPHFIAVSLGHTQATPPEPPLCAEEVREMMEKLSSHYESDYE
jgi:hypothetical protein